MSSLERGHVPTDEQSVTLFRIVLLRHAEQQSDVALFERVLAMLRHRHAGDECAMKLIVEPSAAKPAELKQKVVSGGFHQDGAPAQPVRRER